MQLSDFLQIGVYFLLVYGLLRYLQETGGIRLIFGAVVLAGFLYGALRGLVRLFPEMASIETVLNASGPFVVMALILVFQPELRRGLLRIVENPLVRRLFGRKSRGAIDEVTTAAVHMAQRRTGALIALERNIRLIEFGATGERVDARVSAPLIETIFHKDTPLHDGLLIVSEGRLAFARCVLPLGEPSRPLAAHHGTRHRAAVWLSEQSDAVVVVVSEERGAISTAVGGRLIEGYDGEGLAAFLRRQWSADARPPPAPLPAAPPAGGHP